MEERQPESENMSEDMNSEKQTNVSETLLLEMQDCSREVEAPGDAAKLTLSSLQWTQSLPSTHTVVVPPLSRTEGPQVGGSDREAEMQKLTEMEKEIQRLRRLLDLEITHTTQSTMTDAEGSFERPKEFTASREISCQTDMAEVSTV